ncbi:hypothetical protein [Cellulosimicrobium sp. CUA-896]|uniref:hypothetical protein n=1 Tax=Cellulosimicrobium sp. CUA-896 TaxID=1517881 RepID=UPI00095B3B25|nr:hypothetical protein [Cellulosimicrobium sp. CUA-896]OLT55134.1 hypothetical protein BJF88_07785 [Cellulosimicrobium sp. CUA-896]
MSLMSGLGVIGLLYYLLLLAITVLALWALVLTIKLLRSVLAEREARAQLPPPPGPARGRGFPSR